MKLFQKSLGLHSTDNEIDETCASCIIEAADILCKFDPSTLSSLEYSEIKSKEIDSLCNNIKNGTSSKTYLQKITDPNTLIGAIIQVLMESKRIFSMAQLSAMSSTDNIPKSVESLSSHHRRLLGAIFAMLEVLSYHSESNVRVIASKFSRLLTEAPDDNSSSPGKGISSLFVKLAADSQDLFPYYKTFYQRINKPISSNSKSLWTRLALHNTQSNDITDSSDLLSPFSPNTRALRRQLSAQEVLDDSMESDTPLSEGFMLSTTTTAAVSASTTSQYPAKKSGRRHQGNDSAGSSEYKSMILTSGSLHSLMSPSGRDGGEDFYHASTTNTPRGTSADSPVFPVTNKSSRNNSITQASRTTQATLSVSASRGQDRSSTSKHANVDSSLGSLSPKGLGHNFDISVPTLQLNQSADGTDSLDSPPSSLPGSGTPPMSPDTTTRHRKLPQRTLGQRHGGGIHSPDSSLLSIPDIGVLSERHHRNGESRIPRSGSLDDSYASDSSSLSLQPVTSVGQSPLTMYQGNMKGIAKDGKLGLGKTGNETSSGKVDTRAGLGEVWLDESLDSNKDSSTLHKEDNNKYENESNRSLSPSRTMSIMSMSVSVSPQSKIPAKVSPSKKTGGSLIDRMIQKTGSGKKAGKESLVKTTDSDIMAILSSLEADGEDDSDDDLSFMKNYGSTTANDDDDDDDDGKDEVEDKEISAEESSPNSKKSKVIKDPFLLSSVSGTITSVDVETDDDDDKKKIIKKNILKTINQKSSNLLNSYRSSNDSISNSIEGSPLAELNIRRGITNTSSSSHHHQSDLIEKNHDDSSLNFFNISDTDIEDELSVLKKDRPFASESHSSRLSPVMSPVSRAASDSRKKSVLESHDVEAKLLGASIEAVQDPDEINSTGSADSEVEIGSYLRSSTTATLSNQRMKQHEDKDGVLSATVTTDSTDNRMKKAALDDSAKKSGLVADDSDDEDLAVKGFLKSFAKRNSTNNNDKVEKESEMIKQSNSFDKVYDKGKTVNFDSKSMKKIRSFDVLSSVESKAEIDGAEYQGLNETKLQKVDDDSDDDDDDDKFKFNMNGNKSQNPMEKITEKSASRKEEGMQDPKKDVELDTGSKAADLGESAAGPSRNDGALVDLKAAVLSTEQEKSSDATEIKVKSSSGGQSRLGSFFSRGFSGLVPDKEVTVTRRGEADPVKEEGNEDLKKQKSEEDVVAGDDVQKEPKKSKSKNDFGDKKQPRGILSGLLARTESKPEITQPQSVQVTKDEDRDEGEEVSVDRGVRKNSLDSEPEMKLDGRDRAHSSGTVVEGGARENKDVMQNDGARKRGYSFSTLLIGRTPSKESPSANESEPGSNRNSARIDGTPTQQSSGDNNGLNKPGSRTSWNLKLPSFSLKSKIQAPTQVPTTECQTSKDEFQIPSPNNVPGIANTSELGAEISPIKSEMDEEESRSRQGHIQHSGEPHKVDEKINRTIGNENKWKSAAKLSPSKPTDNLVRSLSMGASVEDSLAYGDDSDNDSDEFGFLSKHNQEHSPKQRIKTQNKGLRDVHEKESPQFKVQKEDFDDKVDHNKFGKTFTSQFSDESNTKVSPTRTSPTRLPSESLLRDRNLHQKTTTQEDSDTNEDDNYRHDDVRSPHRRKPNRNQRRTDHSKLDDRHTESLRERSPSHDISNQGLPTRIETQSSSKWGMSTQSMQTLARLKAKASNNKSGGVANQLGLRRERSVSNNNHSTGKSMDVLTLAMTQGDVDWEILYKFGEDLSFEIPSTEEMKPPDPPTLSRTSAAPTVPPKPPAMSPIHDKREGSHSDREPEPDELIDPTLTPQLSEFMSFSNFFRIPEKTAFYRQIGVDFSGSLEKKGHTGWNKRYMTLSAKSLTTEVPQIAVYTKYVRSAWGDLPLQLRRVIYIEDILSVTTESNVSKEGKVFQIRYIQRLSEDQERVDEQRQRSHSQSSNDRNPGGNGLGLGKDNTTEKTLVLRAMTPELRMRWVGMIEDARKSSRVSARKTDDALH